MVPGPNHADELLRTPELATYFGVRDGVLVTSVTKGSPAERSGIRAGDVIVEVAGKSIGDARELVRQVQDHQGEIAVKVVRDKKELMLTVAPEARSQDPGHPLYP